eukprot:6017-Chlamydomonas_euryale.AAC.2
MQRPSKGRLVGPDLGHIELHLRKTLPTRSTWPRPPVACAPAAPSHLRTRWSLPAGKRAHDARVAAVERRGRLARLLAAHQHRGGLHYAPVDRRPRHHAYQRNEAEAEVGAQ